MLRVLGVSVSPLSLPYSNAGDSIPCNCHFGIGYVCCHVDSPSPGCPVWQNGEGLLIFLHTYLETAHASHCPGDQYSTAPGSFRQRQVPIKVSNGSHNLEGREVFSTVTGGRPLSFSRRITGGSRSPELVEGNAEGEGLPR